MKLYNQGARSFTVEKKFVIKGGSFRPHDREKVTIQINPKDKVEFEEEFGKKILSMYPESFMQLDEVGNVVEPKVKKAAKKKAVIAPLKKRTKTLKVTKKVKKG